MDVCEELEMRLQRRDWRERPEELWAWVAGAAGVERCIASGLEESARLADWLRFEVLVLAGFRAASTAYTTTLARVLDARSGEVNNEDVVELLHDLADPASVPALERALWWQPGWDEFHGLGRKCVQALAAVGTEAAWQVLRDAASSGPVEIREEAASALERR